MFKQWGEWAYVELNEDEERKNKIHYVEIDGRKPDGKFVDTVMFHIGKKACGRYLDGVIHDGFP